MHSDEEIQCTPPEIREAANIAMGDLLPIKSKDKYKTAYGKFVTWARSKNIKNYSENCLIVYFQSFQSNKSLWSTYSMLKSCLLIYDDTDISKYAKLIAYLKQSTKHLRPKKSAVLSEEQITKFIGEAPDSSFLLMKVRSFSYILQ